MREADLVASSSIDAVETDGDPLGLGIAGLSSGFASLLIWIRLIDWLVDESKACFMVDHQSEPVLLLWL